MCIKATQAGEQETSTLDFSLRFSINDFHSEGYSVAATVYYSLVDSRKQWQQRLIDHLQAHNYEEAFIDQINIGNLDMAIDDMFWQAIKLGQHNYNTNRLKGVPSHYDQSTKVFDQDYTKQRYNEFLRNVARVDPTALEE